jgi:hypothetical protein
LVVAITGSTGTGKSETAFRLAEGLLHTKKRVGTSLRFVPNGLLTLRGEDYAHGNLEEVLLLVHIYKHAVGVTLVCCTVCLCMWVWVWVTLGNTCVLHAFFLFLFFAFPSRLNCAGSAPALKFITCFFFFPIFFSRFKHP